MKTITQWHCQRRDINCSWSIGGSMSAWKHVITKHMADHREPWPQWLGEQVFARVTTPAGCAAPDLQQAAAAMQAAITQCVGAPLMLSHSHTRLPERRWLLVLPNGALLVTRVAGHDAADVYGTAAKGRHHLLTCFFPRSAARVHNPARRWHFVVNRLIRRYTQCRPGVGFVQPCSDIAFVSPENWGFRTIGQEKAWRPNWSIYPSEPTRHRPHRRLTPTRRCFYDE